MRSIKERIIHTLLFEGGAILVTAPFVSWMTGAPMAAAGPATIALSGAAVVCNYGWTWVFDRLVPTRQRSFAIRAAQATGFELLFMLVSLPLFLWLGASLGDAILLDVMAMTMFIIYGIVFNWLFDRVMRRIEAKAA